MNRWLLFIFAAGLEGCGQTTVITVACDSGDAAKEEATTEASLDTQTDDGTNDTTDVIESDSGCETGAHRCGDACVPSDSPESCGASCAPCAAPARMTATCDGGACGTKCADGYEMNGTACEPAAPRLIAPLSGSIGTSRRPTFTWKNIPGITSAHVELCTDGLCTTTMLRADVTGSSYTPTTDLPIGTVYWRVFGADASGFGLAPSATWELIIAGARSSSPGATTWGAVADFDRRGFGNAVIGRIPPSSSDVIDAFQGPGLSLSFECGDGERLPVEPAIGDVDGDGWVDLAVGIAADADPLAPMNGRLDVYLGPSLSSGWLVPTEWWYGTTQHYALTVSFAGDVDGDGYGDLAVADPQGGQGQVYLLRGDIGGVSKDPASTLVAPDPAPTVGELEFGDRIAGSGDLNGDGHADLAVHDNFRSVGGGASGHVFVYFGDDRGFTTPPVLLTPPTADANFGNSLHVAGDVNGDGLADLLVADANDGSGEDWVYVYFGSTASPFPTVPAISLHVASASAVPIGDFDADGYSDIAVLADGVTIYGGGPSGPSSTTILGTIPSTSPGPYQLVGGTGDIDGDGFFDLGIVAGDTFYGYAGGKTFSPTPRWSFCGPGGADKPCYTIGLLGGLD